MIVLVDPFVLVALSLEFPNTLTLHLIILTQLLIHFLIKVNNLFVWKNEEAIEEEHDQDMEDIDLVANVGLESVALEEEQAPSSTHPPPSSPRKRARASLSQGMDDEPEWVGGFFDGLSIIETNINHQFDHFDTRFDHFERRMDHVEYDIHQLQAFNNLSCTWPPSMPPS